MSTVFLFSELSNNQEIAFTPGGTLATDDLSFAGLTEEPGQLRFSVVDAPGEHDGAVDDLLISVASGPDVGKQIYLLNVTPNLLSNNDFVWGYGGFVLVGDNEADGEDDGPNMLNGTNNGDLLMGLGGNDTIAGFDGADYMDGGAGADSMRGGIGNDNVIGSAGTDKLWGDGGNDTVSGGAGNDNLWGGAGKDQFLFNSAGGATNADTIKDFVHLTDKIVLDHAVFSALGIAANTLASAKFQSATDIGATSGGTGVGTADRILYDSDSGNLYYDSNGSGAGGRVLLGTVWSDATNHPVLTAADFKVI